MAEIQAVGKLAVALSKAVNIRIIWELGQSQGKYDTGRAEMCVSRTQAGNFSEVRVFSCGGGKPEARGPALDVCRKTVILRA